MIRKEKGITLIALVITIIVLLILAGVSIATLTGANGLLTRANQAREETEMAQLEEEIATLMEIAMELLDHPEEKSFYVEMSQLEMEKITDILFVFNYYHIQFLCHKLVLLKVK